MAEEKKQAALKIVIDDGSQRIPIENMNGDEIGYHRALQRNNVQI